jgi:Zn-dependent protease
MAVTLFGIPVRIKLSFLFVISLLGMSMVRNRSADPLILAGRLGIWLAVVLVSVIVHELGHALMARRFGAEVRIELWALGGLTSWKPGSRLITPAKRAAIAAAGSTLGFLVGAAAFPFWMMVGNAGDTLSLTLGWLVWVNLGWGLINWLPIRVLDGGHIFGAVIDVLWPLRATTIANYLFLATSVTAAFVSYRMGFPIATMFAGFMAFMEVRRLLAISPKPRPAPQPPLTEHFLFDPPPPRTDPEAKEAG